MDQQQLDNLHKPGERVAIEWPGGPHNFVIEFSYADPVRVIDWPGWLVLHGTVVEPEGPVPRQYRAFYVHLVDGAYKMIPFGGTFKR